MRDLWGNINIPSLKGTNVFTDLAGIVGFALGILVGFFRGGVVLGPRFADGEREKGCAEYMLLFSMVLALQCESRHVPHMNSTRFST